MVSLEKFKITMNLIEKQINFDEELSKKIFEFFPENGLFFYNNDDIFSAAIGLLKFIFNDDHKDSWIDYYIYELNFGKKNDKLKAYDKNEKEIPLSNNEDLYNLLISYN